MDRPGFSFCICPDPAIIKERIHALLEKQPGDWDRKVFWGDEEFPASFWESLTLPGLLGGNRAVVLRRAQNLKTEDWNKFVPILSRFSSRIWPFFCLEGEWKGKTPAVPAILSKQKFYKLAREKGWIWSSPGLTLPDIPKRITAWAKQNNLTVAPTVRDSLSQHLPLDATALENELQKLLLVLEDRTVVEQEDLAALSHQPDMNMFDFLNSLVRTSVPEKIWDKVLRSHVGDENLFFPFLALLLREIRILWQLCSGEDELVRLPPPVKNEKKNLARQFGLPLLARFWQLALDAESGVKTGRYSPEQATELLVSGTMTLIRGRSLAHRSTSLSFPATCIR
ncbi:MAG: DNA polymerase III subunit delta [Desulfovibrionales bacterium]